MTLKYRADIDGLRAIAVLAVLLYHVGLRGLPGGFVGVDVFFVISGYLITKIIYTEAARGDFSLARFYERRVRRIFPALFLVMAFCLSTGFFVLMPGEFSALGRSVAATTLFVSNIFFFTTDNYFSPAAEHELLLHTWSLAVEEQFYLLYPLLLVVLTRYSRRTTEHALWALGLVSLATAIVLIRIDPTAAFYLPVSRAWELLFGAVLAIDATRAIRRGWIRETMAALGLVLILGSVHFVTGATIPLPAGLEACVGAGLLIWAGAGEGSVVSRGLGSKPFVYLGRISYSLYLWHWPFLVLYRLLIDDRFRPVDQAILIGSSLAAAALSTRFVERPFRKSASADVGSPAPVLWAGGAAIASVLALTVPIVATGGLSSRFPAEVVRLASYLRYGDIAAFRTNTCFLSTDSNDLRYFQANPCLRLETGRPNLLLIGDSHAADLYPGLAAANPDVAILQATVAGCPPLLDPVQRGPFAETCRGLMRMVFDDWLPAHPVDVVVLASRWSTRQLPGLASTLARVRALARRVYVVGPMSEYSQPLPRLLALAALRQDADLPARRREPLPSDLDGRLRRVVEDSGTTYLSLLDLICPGGACRTVTPDGTPVAFDDNHLGFEGSRWVADSWREKGLLPWRSPSGPGAEGSGG